MERVHTTHGGLYISRGNNAIINADSYIIGRDVMGKFNNNNIYVYK